MSIITINDFMEAAGMNKKYPWAKTRERGEYGEFLIASCRYDDWWYRDFVGVEFFGRMDTWWSGKHQAFYGRRRNVVVCRLTGTKILYGMDIPMFDLILI